ncbi:MAG: acyl-CoA desaturase [Anditalea sp.]
MMLKTICMLSLFLIPIIIVNTGLVTTPLTLFSLYILSGFGMAGIGMGVMHDAIHGSYSKNRQVNKYLGYTMNLIGANASVWRVQHNVLHHNYTNIEEADDDLNAPFFLRFSPHAKRYWLHRFQHFYIWLFYGLSTLSWVTTKDFIRLNRYKNKGFFSGKNEYRKEVIKLIGWKLFYYSYALVLPLIIVPLAPWIIILAFVSMHFVTGLSISIVFQTAHVMPSAEFPLPDENGLIANSWTIHQLATTSNYAPRSRFFSWLIGGLNYQVEHHLLPHVCHVHYRKLSHIVAETAKEYGVPYHTKKTFLAAIVDHIKMLRQLGTMTLAPLKQMPTNK